MNPPYRLQFLALLLAQLLAACTNPISRQALEHVDPTTTLALVSENPSAYLDRKLLLGGAVIVLESEESGSSLEIMEWRLDRWGEPVEPSATGLRFLVRTPQTLDPALYEPGTLITLTGAVNGHEVGFTEGREYDYPTFLLTELYLWHSPFRYGLHSNAAPLFPDFVGHDDDPRRNPYAHGYNPYPYTQYWYRNGGN